MSSTDVALHIRLLLCHLDAGGALSSQIIQPMCRMHAEFALALTKLRLLQTMTGSVNEVETKLALSTFGLRYRPHQSPIGATALIDKLR
jgi:hypothetical protein